MRNISPPRFLKQLKDASLVLTMWVLGELIAVLDNVRVRIALSLSHGFQKFKRDDEFLPCVGQFPFLFNESLCESFYVLNSFYVKGIFSEEDVISARLHLYS